MFLYMNFSISIKSSSSFGGTPNACATAKNLSMGSPIRRNHNTSVGQATTVEQISGAAWRSSPATPDDWIIDRERLMHIVQGGQKPSDEK